MAIKTNTIRANTIRDDEQVSPEPSEQENDQTKSKKGDKREKPPKKLKPPKEQKPKKEPKKRDLRIVGLFFLLFGTYLLLALGSFVMTWQEDFTFVNHTFNNFSFSYFVDPDHPIENITGKFGALLSYLFIYAGIGLSAFLIIVYLGFAGIKLLLHIGKYSLWNVLKYCFVGIVWIPVFLSVVIPDEQIYYGIYGFQVNKWLTAILGTPGLILLLIFTFLSFTILAFNIPFRWFKRKETSVEEPQNAPLVDNAIKKTPLDPEEVPSISTNLFIDEPEVSTEVEEEPFEMEDTPSEPIILEDNTPGSIELEIEKPKDEVVVDPEDSQVQEHFTLDTKYDPTLELRGYKFPPIELLSDYGGESIGINNDELAANKNRIVETLNNYAIKIQKIKATIGPAVTLYEIVPEPGIRISRIKNLENDIALSLAALGIRIIAPIPGKGTIGIEVPNQNPEIVSIKSLLASEKFQKSGFELPFVLGKTIANETFIADLTKMPHILMAGATGQGKSVGLNTIITSLLYKKHPSLVKFVMIDPKKVELSLFSKIERHYLAKLPDQQEAIITDTKKVIRTLVSLNKEMDDRYDLLQDAQVRNLREYNEKFTSRKLNPNDNHRFLPYIIVFVDEFADLIMTAGREIETPITRLAQLARAVGIHLIIATQRPSVNIITGTIKANFPVRIAFKVASKIDSRTILDQSGADQLVGRGDMLLSMGSDLIRLQCAFVDTPEIEKVTDFIGSQRGFSEPFLLPEVYDEENEGAKEVDSGERDALFAEAARLIVQNQQGSTSLIQRKLKLGYNRAGRIIDQLESAGIVGPFEGSKAREVRYTDLNSLDEYLKILGV